MRQPVRKLTIDNIDSITEAFHHDLAVIGESIAGKTGISLMLALKRDRLGHGPYPDVSLFEAGEYLDTAPYPDIHHPSNQSSTCFHSATTRALRTNSAWTLSQKLPPSTKKLPTNIKSPSACICQRLGRTPGKKLSK